MNEPAADIQRHGAIASHLLPLAEGSFLPAIEHSLHIETVEGTAFHHCGRTPTRGVYSRVDKDATHCQAATRWHAVAR